LKVLEHNGEVDLEEVITLQGYLGGFVKVAPHHTSIILPDIRIRPVEQVLILMQLVLPQRLPQRLLDLPLAGDGLLPAGEADDAHDLVNVVDDALDHDGGVEGRASTKLNLAAFVGVLQLSGRLDPRDDQPNQRTA